MASKMKVKVSREKLLKDLREIRSRREKELQRDTAAYEKSRVKALAKIAGDLRTAADAIEGGDDIYVSTETVYRDRSGTNRDQRIMVAKVPVTIHVPNSAPEFPYYHRELVRAIALLERSDDEFVTLTEADLDNYGVGSLLNSDEEQ